MARTCSGHSVLASCSASHGIASSSSSGVGASATQSGRSVPRSQRAKSSICRSLRPSVRRTSARPRQRERRPADDDGLEPQIESCEVQVEGSDGRARKHGLARVSDTPIPKDALEAWLRQASLRREPCRRCSQRDFPEVYWSHARRRSPRAGPSSTAVKLTVPASRSRATRRRRGGPRSRGCDNTRSPARYRPGR